LGVSNSRQGLAGRGGGTGNENGGKFKTFNKGKGDRQEEDIQGDEKAKRLKLMVTVAQIKRRDWAAKPQGKGSMEKRVLFRRMGRGMTRRLG